MSARDPAANFDRLVERLRICGRIATRSGLHVGAGPDHERASCGLPVLCDRDGLPLIPGSSLKGTLRSSAEALLRAAQRTSLPVCDPLEDRRGAPCEVRSEGAAPRCCSVCSVFGTRGIAGRVRFVDAPLAEREGPVPIELREGVALDRDLGTAHSARRYELELVPPGTAFELEIFVDNAEPWMLGLLLCALEQLDAGFTALGGFCSRGLGRVAIQLQAVERTGAAAILAGQPPEQIEGEALEALLASWREALGERAREEAA